MKGWLTLYALFMLALFLVYLAEGVGPRESVLLVVCALVGNFIGLTLAVTFIAAYARRHK